MEDSTHIQMQIMETLTQTEEGRIRFILTEGQNPKRKRKKRFGFVSLLQSGDRTTLEKERPR